MILEIIITLLIIAAVGFILYKNIKNKSAGQCDCGSCSEHCPHYELEHRQTK